MLAVAAAGCRSLILEDRGDCPCFLFFDIQNAREFKNTEEVYAAAFQVPETGLYVKPTTNVYDIVSQEFYFKLKKRGNWGGYAVCGHYGANLQDETDWVVPEGSEFVPLYRFDWQTEGFEESKVLPVEFIKEYSRVLIRFKHFDQFSTVEGQFPFEVMIRSNTCGINALTGLPVRGAYLFKPEEEMGGEFRFILPRQADNALTMELWVKEGIGYWQEGLADTFNLWRMFNEAGSIDWTEKNLPDIELEIDYVERTYTVNVVEWTYAEEFSYEF